MNMPMEIKAEMSHLAYVHLYVLSRFLFLFKNTIETELRCYDWKLISASLMGKQKQRLSVS